MTPAILFVDDEQNILNSLNRLFMDTNLRVLNARTGKEALDIIRKDKIAVIVSDNMMPEMKGVELLRKAKDISPDSVRVLMTGYADVNTIIDAINKGEVYRFITKPWVDDELQTIVYGAVEHFKVALSLKNGDEEKLRSLAQTIELKDPYTKGHCDRVAGYAIEIGNALDLSSEDLTCIKHGSWLHDCGKIGVPEATLLFAGPLSLEQMVVVQNHCQWGAEVARLARLPEKVINVILYHHERFNGKGYPFGLKGDAIPIEARIVAVADTYDALTSDRPYRTAMNPHEALDYMFSQKDQFFDPMIVDTFNRVAGGNGRG